MNIPAGKALTVIEKIRFHNDSLLNRERMLMGIANTERRNGMQRSHGMNDFRAVKVESET